MDLNREPATKADLQALKADLDALEQRMEGRIQRLTDRFTEAIRHREAKLLEAFYFFAEINIKQLV